MRTGLKLGFKSQYKMRKEFNRNIEAVRVGVIFAVISFFLIILNNKSESLHEKKAKYAHKLIRLTQVQQANSTEYSDMDVAENYHDLSHPLLSSEISNYKIERSKENILI